MLYLAFDPLIVLSKEPCALFIFADSASINSDSLLRQKWALKFFNILDFLDYIFF
jgi:hypothetical protein